MIAHYQTCRNLTLAGARAVRECAADRAAALSLAIAIVVMDRSGALLLAEVADGAAPGSMDAALMKARGAARSRSATHLTAEYLKTLPVWRASHALSLPELCAFQGGVPIRIGDEVIGAIGIAGGSGEQDIAIATEAAARVASY
ncbi:MAG: GlcG/HbpS family heme-binding protein [Rhizomicrobium sp.]